MKNNNRALENYMGSDKLEAFVDAVLAIILTVIVLELPQPESISLLGFWNLRANFFSYLTSFIVILANWYFFHVIFSIVKSIDGKVIGITGCLIFVISLLPYFTILISNNFNNFYAQLTYCIFFIVVEVTYDISFNVLIRIENNKELENILSIKRTIFHILFYIVGILIGYYFYPPIILIFVFLTVLSWFIDVYRSIVKIEEKE